MCVMRTHGIILAARMSQHYFSTKPGSVGNLDVIYVMRVANAQALRENNLNV